MATIINDESSNNDEVSPHFNRVIELLKLTLKAVILINGGGAIAILTLIGGILSSGSDAVPSLLAWAIGCFGFGVFFGVIALIKGYRSVHHTYLGARQLLRAESISEEFPEERVRHYMIGIEGGLHALKIVSETIKLASISVAFFVIGIVCVTLAFLI